MDQAARKSLLDTHGPLRKRILGVPPPTELGQRSGRVGRLLTGPIYVEGAEPGDTLEVRVIDTAVQSDFAINRTITVGLLPPLVRSQYGLAWHAHDARRLERSLALLRRMRAVTPDRLATWPESRRAR